MKNRTETRAVESKLLSQSMEAGFYQHAGCFFFLKLFLDTQVRPQSRARACPDSKQYWEPSLECLPEHTRVHITAYTEGLVMTNP